MKTIKKHSSSDRNVYIYNTSFGEKACVIQFGKVDYYSGGHRRNLVEVRIALRDKMDGRKEFSVTGDVWNSTQSDAIECGQCDNTIYRLSCQFSDEGREIARKIIKIWREWHLNDMRAGTIEQERCIKDNAKERKEIAKEMNKDRGPFDVVSPNGYDVECELLKRHGLYEVEHDGKPFEYGHGWIYRELPQSLLNALDKLFAIDGGCFDIPCGDKILEALSEA